MEDKEYTIDKSYDGLVVLESYFTKRKSEIAIIQGFIRRYFILNLMEGYLIYRKSFSSTSSKQKHSLNDFLEFALEYPCKPPPGMPYGFMALFRSRRYYMFTADQEAYKQWTNAFRAINKKSNNLRPIPKEVSLTSILQPQAIIPAQTPTNEEEKISYSHQKYKAEAKIKLTEVPTAQQNAIPDTNKQTEIKEEAKIALIQNSQEEKKHYEIPKIIEKAKEQTKQPATTIIIKNQNNDNHTAKHIEKIISPKKIQSSEVMVVGNEEEIKPQHNPEEDIVKDKVSYKVIIKPKKTKEIPEENKEIMKTKIETTVAKAPESKKEKNKKIYQIERDAFINQGDSDEDTNKNIVKPVAKQEPLIHSKNTEVLVRKEKDADSPWDSDEENKKDEHKSTNSHKKADTQKWATTTNTNTEGSKFDKSWDD